MGIKDLTKKLNEIDIQDLKNIDFVQIKDNFQKRPDILIIVVLTGLTFFASVSIYSGHKRESSTLKGEITRMQEKIEALKAQKIAKENLELFFDQYPIYLSSENVVDKISEFAVTHNIQIETFSPAKNAEDDFHVLSSIRINVSIDDDSNIIAFLREIEDSEHSLRISKWSGHLYNKRSKNDEKDYPIEALIEIESLQLKNE